MYEFNGFKLVEGFFDEIGEKTLVGYLDWNKFPIKHGNCFSGYNSTNNKSYKILNMGVENLRHLLEIDNNIKFPIKIGIIKNTKYAFVMDERIPEDYIRNRICESCCPKEYLPYNQRMEHLRDIQRGIRTESKIEIDGEEFGLISVKINPITKPIKFGFKQEVDFTNLSPEVIDNLDDLLTNAYDEEMDD